MTLTEKQKFDAACRMIKVVTGEEYGDGMTVTNIGIGYAEPGYHNDETVWVLGDYNDKPCKENESHHKVCKLPSRLFEALERIGVEGEWEDEWIQCSHCYRIVRCVGDSYSWQPYYVIVNECEPLCGDCARDPDFVDDVINEFVNNYQKCVTLFDSKFLEERGWTKYNERNYENGWHPGQTDDPEAISRKVEKALPDYDWLFLLEENSQFYTGFSIYTKPKSEDEDDR